MRSLIFVEKSTPQDTEALIAAMDSTPQNLVDHKVYGYPATSTLKAVKDGKPLVFMPIHPVFMLESLGIINQNSQVDTAIALAELIKTVRWEAHNAGHGEMFFACSEPTTQAFAEKHGFERVNVPMFKMRVR